MAIPIVTADVVEVSRSIIYNYIDSNRYHLEHYSYSCDSCKPLVTCMCTLYFTYLCVILVTTVLTV